MKKILLLLSLFALSHQLFAQKGLNKLNYAELDSMVYVYYEKGAYDKAIPYIQAALEKSKIEFGTKDSVYAEYTGNLAVFYYLSGQYQKAEPLYLEAKEIRANTVGKEHPLYATAINNLAMLYKATGNHAKAEPLMLETKNIDSKVFGKEHERYAIDITNLASVYVSMGNYEQAEPLFLEANVIKAKVLGKEHPLYATNLDNLATLYQQMKRYKEAEPLFIEGNNIKAKVLGKEHPDYALGLNNLAMLYQSLGLYEKTVPLYIEAIKIKEKVLGKNHVSYATSIGNLALSYRFLGKYKESEALYLEALNIKGNAMGKEAPDYARSLFVLAGLYQDMGKLDTAFQYCLRSFDANSAQIDSSFTDIENLDKFEFYANQEIVESIVVLLMVLKSQYEKSGDQSKLDLYYNVSKMGMRLNERIRNNFSSEGDKLRILRENNRLVKTGIESALLLKKEIYKKEAFTFAEQNKSILLADAIKGNRARVFGDLPDSLAEKELALQTKMTSLKKQQILPNSDEVKNKINQSISDLNLEINTFLKSIKDKYPKYHALKYENITAKAEDIQKLLDKETALLEYFLTDSISYLFLVSSKEVQLYPIPITMGELKKRIQALRFALSDYQMVVKEEEKAYTAYTKEAYWFYKELVSIAIDKKGFKNLIIVTDGELGHLPFEAFLVQPGEQNKKGQYNNLHYLVKDYNISYNYSATLFANAVRSHGSKNESTSVRNAGQMLACAAAYPKIDSTLLALRLPYFYRLRETLAPLPEAQNEIKSLSENFQGAFLLDDAANEKFFKENAGNYAVIHLAMHGMLDARAPMLSSLAFTENRDSVEDNFLQAFEIAHLKLNADLVVLSACETGYGQFEQGEGIVSLARSFMYAGAPSLVVSLWQVNDHSTSIIMTSFYQYLTDGLSKSEALRQAKLDYIKIANGVAAHPAFWSPFIQLGDSSPIYLKAKSGWMYWVIGGVGLVLGIGFLIWRKGKEVA